jgi:hypothetical protein
MIVLAVSRIRFAAGSGKLCARKVQKILGLTFRSVFLCTTATLLFKALTADA